MNTFENKRYLYDYIKQEINNMSYIQQYVTLKRMGIIFKGICPFHKEKTASFTVYPPDYENKGKKQKFASFYCFGCGAAGDIIKFKQLKDNLSSYYEAAIQLAIEYKLNIDNDNDIRMNYLKSISIDRDTTNNLSLEQINLTCSSIIRNYLKTNNNDEAKEKARKYLVYLDNELNERNAIQAQSLIDETINDFKI